MKTIGLIGGMSWVSTIEYYRILNEATARVFGAAHSAKIIVFSVDFAEIVSMQKKGAWEEAGRYLATAAQTLETAGAELLLIGAVTMHKVAQFVQEAIDIPLIHIADVTAAAVKAKGIRKIGLLGTQYTMESSFFIERLSNFGIKVIVPHQIERERVHQIILEELTKGKINPASRKCMLEMVQILGSMGAEGIILGCTELSLMVTQADIALPLFDTTYIHANSAVEKAVD
jgi:aspartate racemase